jgi:hypothetical protein
MHRQIYNIIVEVLSRVVLYGWPSLRVVILPPSIATSIAVFRPLAEKQVTLLRL